MIAKKILIIDDDRELCEELSEILFDEGYQVDVAFDGLAGKEFLEHNGYNLVILDLKLPKLNGFEILRSLQQTWEGFKILVLSGRPNDGTLMKDSDIHQQEEKILKMVDCFMSKPFDVDLLLKRIQKLVS